MIMIVAVEAAKQGVTMGEDTVSGLTFVCGRFRGDMRNTRRIAEKYREITRRVQLEINGE